MALGLVVRVDVSVEVRLGCGAVFTLRTLVWLGARVYHEMCPQAHSGGELAATQRALVDHRGRHWHHLKHMAGHRQGVMATSLKRDICLKSARGVMLCHAKQRFCKVHTRQTEGGECQCYLLYET